ncbi:hypothetical protein FGG78_32785, partial [Thioclava sp. BHET1]
MIRPFLRRVDGLTMYRLVLLYAACLVALALIAGVTRYAVVPAAELTFSLVLMVVVCVATNRLFTSWLNIPANAESTLITA